MNGRRLNKCYALALDRRTGDMVVIVAKEDENTQTSERQQQEGQSSELKTESLDTGVGGCSTEFAAQAQSSVGCYQDNMSVVQHQNLINECQQLDNGDGQDLQGLENSSNFADFPNLQSLQYAQNVQDLSYRGQIVPEYNPGMQPSFEYGRFLYEEEQKRIYEESMRRASFAGRQTIPFDQRTQLLHSNQIRQQV